MAKSAKATANESPGETTSVTEFITYLPGQSDPATVTWCGHTFRANLPKEITGRDGGSEREQLNYDLIERARDNPHFKVEGAKPKRSTRDLPQSADEYRAYIAAWLQDPNLQHADRLIARFAQDRELQAACEVGTSDWSMIGALFMPKLHELAKADELTEGQVAQLWVNAGINQLPW
ncbi:MAG: hypothetical protein PS018_20305 [bacterium]|nr:hypothetical protein [bacterium]